MPKGRKKKHAAPRYVSNAAELNNRSKAFGKEELQRRARRKAAGCDDDSDDDLARRLKDTALSSEEDGSSDEGPRVCRQKEKKPKGVQGLLETENPNARRKKNTLSAKDAAAGKFEKAELTRREREALEAQGADKRAFEAARAGKTTQAKKDLARLAERRAAREAKKLEREEAAAAAKKQEELDQIRKKQLLEEAAAGSQELEKPTKIEIKKMKPAKLKELLKERGLSAQGNKKQLSQRLLEACGY